MTRTGDVLGTPFYMAPEQISDAAGAIDERTDVYALGATLYELLTLRPPYFGERREQVIAKIMHDEPTPPRTINRQVPRDLDTICLKAVEKQPGRRYRSSGAMAEDCGALPRGSRFWRGGAGQLGGASSGSRGIGQRRQCWRESVHRSSSRCSSRIEPTSPKHAGPKPNSAGSLKRLRSRRWKAISSGPAARSSKPNNSRAPPGQLSLLKGQLALQAGKPQVACDELELALGEMPDSLAAQCRLFNQSLRRK